MKSNPCIIISFTCKKLHILYVFILLSIFSSNATQRFSVIPYPNNLESKQGEFTFKNKLTVKMPKNLNNEFNYLVKVLKDEMSIHVSKDKHANILFEKSNILSDEAYVLNVSEKQISIAYGTNSGCFYAIQTIRQLIKLNGDGSYSIPACYISDKPSYSWRSFMLDESRHFKGKSFVKQLLDQMAYLKMNVFHWHLVDEQGWRIQIDKYPELTNVGSWRDSTQIARVSKGKQPQFYPYAHGGFYTKSDVKEIVAYAASLHINVVPEIEMPGHASAAIAAYPWLSASSEIIKVPCTFGVFKSSYNVADEKVFSFLYDVLDEIMPLFPFKTIHIGGDEVKYDQWISNDSVKELMQQQGFKSPSDLHVYFVNKISKYIVLKGYRMMGWNDILGKNVHEWSKSQSSNEKLSNTTIVQFWKGDSKMLIDAIEQGYQVVNSNHWDTYLDYTYKITPLKKAYSFSPLVVGVSQKYKKNVLGFGCQMWSEYIPKVTDAYRQIFPRIAAFAEVGWTEESKKNFERFSNNLILLKRYWDTKGITYWEE